LRQDLTWKPEKGWSVFKKFAIIMKKLDKLVLGSLMLTAAQIYATPPPEEMVKIAQVATNGKVQLFEKKIQGLIPSERRALANHMISYIILADLVYASNATEVILMPYVQYICPKNPGRELQESGIRIGPIFSEELAEIIAPPLEFRYLSEGEMRPRNWDYHSYQGPENWEQSGDYMTLLQKLGPLTPIYLDALHNPERVVLPKNVVRPIAYPENVPLLNADEKPNIDFFQQWYNNICLKYFVDDASATMTSFLYFCCFVRGCEENLRRGLQAFSRYLDEQKLNKSPHLTSLKGVLKEKFPWQGETIDAAFQSR
jgi:hypothetical protein